MRQYLLTVSKSKDFVEEMCFPNIFGVFFLVLLTNEVRRIRKWGPLRSVQNVGIWDR